MLAAASYAGRIKLIDSETGVVRWEVKSEPDCLSMSLDGRFVASVGASVGNWKQQDETWTLWDAESGFEWMTGARHDGTGACACTFTRSGHRKTLDAKCPVHAHTLGLSSVAFSPCGKRLATGGLDHAVVLWDAQTGKAEQVMQGHSGRVVSVCFSADGARLASGSWDGSIRVWDAATGRSIRTIEDAHDALVDFVNFSTTDNRMLASVGNSARLWNVDSGAMTREFEGCNFAVHSPDGRTIATGSAFSGKQDVLLVDAVTGALRVRLVGHQKEVITASHCVDGSKLASGSEDGTCKVWDSSTGVLLRSIAVGWICFISWGRDWVVDKQRVMAFVMGHHPRLGAGSRVLGLDEELLRMILDLA